MKITKIVLIMMIFAAAIFAQNKQISSFDELMSALKSGEDVKVVIYYGNCQLIIDDKEEESPDAIGGMKFDTFEYFAKMSIRNDKAYVTASETVLIAHPFYGYVLNYAKIRVYEDNSVELIARYLNPHSYEVKMDETFRTNINNGSNEGAVYLYR